MFVDCIANGPQFRVEESNRKLQYAKQKEDESLRKKRGYEQRRFQVGDHFQIKTNQSIRMT